MIVPIIMQPDYFKRFVKVTDIYLFIPAGYISEWPDNMHGDLKIDLYSPLIRHEPWDWSQVQFMGRLGSMASELHLTNASRGRDLLHQFWCARNCIVNMPLGLVRTLLLSETWHKILDVSKNQPG